MACWRAWRRVTSLLGPLLVVLGKVGLKVLFHVGMDTVGYGAGVYGSRIGIGTGVGGGGLVLREEV